MDYTNPRTAVRDAVLASVGSDHGGGVVAGIEWAAVMDTIAVCRNGHHLVDFEEYVGYGSGSVAL